GGRVYDAEIGRFLSADPFVGDSTNLQALNRYSYVENNPLSYTDPSGFFLKKLVKKIGKAIGSALDSIANGIKSGLIKIGREFANTPGLSAVIVGFACGMGGPAGCVLAGKIMMGLNAAITAANGGTIQHILTDLAVGAVVSGIPGGGSIFQSGLTGQLATAFGEGVMQSFGAAMFMGGLLLKRVVRNLSLGLKVQLSVRQLE
ncbi:RHS repeat-associated core domain-containing protein, partial [Zhongshania borealis]|uniref:RHS repeat domain-containing protein n=1 Tax=Zhongshania borealis TaxID=889488 RepID=UPI0031EB4761